MQAIEIVVSKISACEHIQCVFIIDRVLSADMFALWKSAVVRLFADTGRRNLPLLHCDVLCVFSNQNFIKVGRQVSSTTLICPEFINTFITMIT